MTNLENRKNKFITKAINKFNDKFNYDDMIYVNMSTKTTIKCKIHGLIDIIPTNFLESKYGCKLCANDKHKLTTTCDKKLVKFKLYTKDDGIFIVDNIKEIEQHERIYTVLKIEAVSN